MSELRTHVARLEGEIDLANAASLEQEILGQLRGAGALVIDLGEVTYFDSSGLRMLDGLAGACDAAGLPLRVVAPDGSRAQFVLHVVAWPKQLIAESVDEALAAI